MDLSALNRTPIGAAARGVGRVAFGAVSGFTEVATGTAGVLSTVVFRTRASWSVLLNRTNFDYKREVGDPINNSIVGAVVGWIARNFPEAPVKLVREGSMEELYPPSATGPGAMLRLLEKPNDWYSGVLQWMATVIDWVVDGNAYWVKVRNGSDRVVELWWVPARMMEPRWPQNDGRVFISHYDYVVDGVVWQIPPRNVVHFRNGIDPDNPRKGRSKLKSLLREIFTDDEAANFTASLMRNLGVPGVIIAPANTTAGSVGRSDPNAVKQKFMETFGGDKRGQPMVLTAPTEIKVLSWSPEQMNLTALRRIPEERVSGVLGVPAMVAQLGAGLERSSFTNYSEANVAAYTQGVIPDHRLVAAELEVQLLPEFASEEQISREGIDVWFDWTKVSAMQYALERLWKTHESAATKGLLTRAAFLRAVRLPATEADEVYVMPNNYVAVPVSGGNPPPTPGARATVSRVPAPELAGSSGPLLLASHDGQRAVADAEDVRCTGCHKLLGQRKGEITGGVIAIKCHRCGEVNEAA